jgi:hypothetical protein
MQGDFLFVGFGPVFPAADVEHVGVHVVPPHRDLDDSVEIDEGEVSWNTNASPNTWRDPSQFEV